MTLRPSSPVAMPYKVGLWFDCNPHKTRLPHHVERYLKQEERRQQIENPIIEVSEGAVDDIEAELEELNGSRSARRCAERELANYIDRVYESTGEPSLRNVAAALRSCRTCGVVGKRLDHGHIVAWDEKCGMVRLCPDESREETLRIAERYVPEMLSWLTERCGPRRAQFAVFTMPNYPPGGLKKGKQEIFNAFRRWLKEHPSVKGALAVEEDPLSQHFDWNVHLNVLLLIEGSFDWASARAAWGANVHFSKVRADGKSLIRAILETIKYSAQIVPTKSAEKAERHATEAPAMTEWPPGRFVEWWHAQEGFRRTRGYGVLHAIERKRWERASTSERNDFLNAAGLATHLAESAWTDLPEKTRARLRKAMVRGKPLDMDSIQWVGQIHFDGSIYWVDLIPADKSPKYPGDMVGNSQASNFSSRGPPALKTTRVPQ